MILRQHKAAQLRAKVAVDPSRQRGHDCAAIRGQPAFPSKPDSDRAHNQILDEIGLIALEARPRRHLRRQDPIFDRRTNPLGSATPAPAPAGGRPRFRRLLHARRLDRRRSLQTFQPRDFRALLRHDPLQFRDLAPQCDHQSPQLGI